jgi:hypothetical protein
MTFAIVCNMPIQARALAAFGLLTLQASALAQSGSGRSAPQAKIDRAGGHLAGEVIGKLKAAGRTPGESRATVVGFGKLGAATANALKRSGMNVTVVDATPEGRLAAAAKGYEVYLSRRGLKFGVRADVYNSALASHVVVDTSGARATEGVPLIPGTIVVESRGKGTRSLASKAEPAAELPIVNMAK